LYGGCIIAIGPGAQHNPWTANRMSPLPLSHYGFSCVYTHTYMSGCRSCPNKLLTCSVAPASPPPPGLHPFPSRTAAVVAAVTHSWQREDEEENVAGGLDSMRPDAYVVNGQVTQHNPWAANNMETMMNYRAHKARKQAEAAAAESAAASSSSGRS
jgi:hypothetical protein